MSANKGTHFYLGLFLTLDQLLVQLALVGLVSCCGAAFGGVLAPSISCSAWCGGVSSHL